MPVGVTEQKPGAARTAGFTLAADRRPEHPCQRGPELRESARSQRARDQDVTRGRVLKTKEALGLSGFRGTVLKRARERESLRIMKEKGSREKFPRLESKQKI